MDIFPEKRILTVSQLTHLITGVLEENFDHVWVEGEVSNLATPASGHLYFTLKDAGSQIRSVIFKPSARSLKFKPADGMHLIVRGRVSVFAQRGEYQIIAEYMEPKGIGALQLAFIQLKGRLAQEGLFSDARKKPIPRLPHRIGIVTSPTGAAIHDIMNVIDRRFSNIHLLLNPVRVQGEGAAHEIASAIRDFNKSRIVDVIIVGRGGGSIEDLWAFNEETVARAIAESRIPVISAVGHEVDITIADLAADLRAPTPSAAAELVISAKAELSGSLVTLVSRLERSLKAVMKEKKGEFLFLQKGLKDPSGLFGRLSQRYDYLMERLTASIHDIIDFRERQTEGIARRLSSRDPRQIIQLYRDQLSSLSARQERAVNSCTNRLKESVTLCVTGLEKLSPLATLGRGYSLAYRSADGLLVTDSRQVTAGDRIGVQFAHGKADCIVEKSVPAGNG